MEWILQSVIVVLIFIAYLLYKLGLKKGANDFLNLLLKGAFQGRIHAFDMQNKYIIKGGIVFVGDSLTQEYNVQDYFPNQNVYNRGIGGDTTEGLLTRLKVSVYDLEPKAVFLLIGTNDLALLETTNNKVIDNIQKIVDTIYKELPKTKIYIQSLYPINPYLDKNTVGKRTNKDIEYINEKLKNMKQITFIPMYDKLVLDGVLNAKYSVEGLHINATGYALITEVLKPYIEKL